MNIRKILSAYFWKQFQYNLTLGLIVLLVIFGSFISITDGLLKRGPVSALAQEWDGTTSTFFESDSTPITDYSNVEYPDTSLSGSDSNASGGFGTSGSSAWDGTTSTFFESEAAPITNYPDYSNTNYGGWDGTTSTFFESEATPISYPDYGNVQSTDDTAQTYPNYSVSASTTVNYPSYPSYPTSSITNISYPNYPNQVPVQYPTYPATAGGNSTNTYYPYSYYAPYNSTYTDNSRYNSTSTSSNRTSSTSSTKIDSHNDSHDIVGSYNDDHSLDSSFNREGFNTSVSDSRNLSDNRSYADSFNVTYPTYPMSASATQSSGGLLQSGRTVSTTQASQPVYTTTSTTAAPAVNRVITSQSTTSGTACPTGTTQGEDGQGKTICIVNQAENKTAAVIQKVEPKVVAVSGASDTEDLPKTGIPLAAWAVSGLLPFSGKLKRFRKSAIFFEENANTIWEQRELSK